MPDKLGKEDETDRNFMAELQGITAEVYKAIITIVDDRVKEIKVTREDFDALKAVVRELAEAQRRTEIRLDSLTHKIEELAEAQKRTEARLDSLTLRVEELAEAQKRTESRVEELAEAQKRTESRVEELAEAQKKTEEILQGVIKEQKNMRKEIGGLSATIGYTLENRAISKLPGLLKTDHGIRIDIMDRRFIEYPDGKEEEVNIYGEGRVNGERVYVVGESKSQLGRKDVDRFKRRLERLKKYLGAPIIPVIVTHMARPRIERYALQAIEGLLIYRSYQLED